MTTLEQKLFDFAMAGGLLMIERTTLGKDSETISIVGTLRSKVEPFPKFVCEKFVPVKCFENFRTPANVLAENLEKVMRDLQAEVGESVEGQR